MPAAVPAEAAIGTLLKLGQIWLHSRVYGALTHLARRLLMLSSAPLNRGGSEA